MRKNNTEHASFIDCKNLEDNTAIFKFNDNTLKLGNVSFLDKQLNRLSLMFSTDLKNFVKSGGNTSNLTANEVYTHLLNNQ